MEAYKNALNFLSRHSAVRLNGFRKTYLIHRRVYIGRIGSNERISTASSRLYFSLSENFFAVTKTCFALRHTLASCAVSQTSLLMWEYGTIRRLLCFQHENLFWCTHVPTTPRAAWAKFLKLLVSLVNGVILSLPSVNLRPCAWIPATWTPQVVPLLTTKAFATSLLSSLIILVRW